MLHGTLTQLTQPQKKKKKISRATRKSSFLVTLKPLTNYVEKTIAFIWLLHFPTPWYTHTQEIKSGLSPYTSLELLPSSAAAFIQTFMVSFLNNSTLTSLPDEGVISLKHPSHLAALLPTSLQPCSRWLPGFSPNPPAWFKRRATKPRMSSAGEDVEPPELSYMAGRNAGWRAALERQFGSFLQTKHTLCPISQQSHT